MGRKHLKNWPDCLKDMSLQELQGWLDGFHLKARVWPKIRKECLKSARLIEKEIARRESSSDSD
jgi:hypothetical protein